MSDSEDFQFEDYDQQLAKLDKKPKGKGKKGTKQLVIVESPAKTKKIGGFLGSDFIVESSVGHIRILGGKGIGLGVDVHDNFKPTYQVDDRHKKVVVNLKKKLKECHTVWLATDFDREGEGIAWHCYDVLGLDKSKIKVNRIVFKKITKKDIIHAVKNPTELDQNMVNAQQARQILDKLLGFRVSGTLHKRFNNYTLSAGRVQSVAVKLILERENDIKKFESSIYFKVDGQFQTNNPKKDKKSKGYIHGQLNTNFDNLDKAKKFIEDCKDAKFKVNDIKTTNSKRKPSPPFTTSSLQQEASFKLGYSPQRTMQAAQRLYEGGHITYMRTDSLMLAGEALDGARDKIIKDFGEKYHKETRYKTKKSSSQEAHEACRPCNMDVSDVTSKTNTEQARLYKLIWARTMASQMSPANVEIKTVKIEMDNRDELFVAKGEDIKFDGFLAVWSRIKNKKSSTKKGADQDYEAEEDDNEEEMDENEKQMALFKKLEKDKKLYYNSVNAVEKVTKPPHARFTEASLVKKLEDLEIGRPSTYATIIANIQKRGYVQRKNQEGTVVEGTSIHLVYPGDVTSKKVTNKLDAEKNKLFITDLGKLTCEYLMENFDDIMDYKFTAHVENMLDEIAQGKKVWYKVIKSVYDKFNPVVENIIKQFKTGGGSGSYERLLGQDPDTGRNVVVLVARYGPVVCLTHPDDKKKCKYSGLDKNKIESVTFEEAMNLLKYPYTIGQWQGADVIIKRGPNGYYLHYNGKNYSLETNEDEDNLYETVTLDIAIKYIEKKAKEISSTCFAEFNKGKIRVLMGKYGPYIAYDNKGKRVNIKVPAIYKPDEITKEECMEIINKKLKKDIIEKDNKKTTTTAAKKKTTTTTAAKKKTTTTTAAKKKTTTAAAKKKTTTTAAKKKETKPKKK